MGSVGSICTSGSHRRVGPGLSGSGDIGCKEQLLSAAVGANLAVPTGDVHADRATSEILRYAEGCPTAAEGVENDVSDVAVQLDESARKLIRELARVIQ